MQVLSARAKELLRSFDIDGDGGFGLNEFVLFLVLLSMPLRDMQAWLSSFLVFCPFFLLCAIDAACAIATCCCLL